jgi:hypothetical protein
MQTMIFLKNWLNKKGVGNFFYLSNGINKSISNFRETIPLTSVEDPNIFFTAAAPRKICGSGSHAQNFA